ncbi:MAG: hypothetical protein LUG49_05760 [Oscillospiraceae bacterium]|nr:hypothetical protein [Oscillospiraceae bacterium]
MKKNLISDAITDINPAYVEQASDYQSVAHRARRPRVIAAVVAAVILTVTAFAAGGLRTASDAANRWGMTTLAEFFEDGGGETFGIAPQTSGGYTVGVLGIATGYDLSEYDMSVDVDKTYIVTSIERADGEALTDYPDIWVSTFISGYEPWMVNNLTLGAGEFWMHIEDGVEYFIVETTNVTAFADHTVYVAVYSYRGENVIPLKDEAYTLNDDGTISVVEGYDGVATLFEIPLDEALADPEAAEALIEKIY